MPTIHALLAALLLLFALAACGSQEPASAPVPAAIGEASSSLLAVPACPPRRYADREWLLFFPPHGTNINPRSLRVLDTLAQAYGQDRYGVYVLLHGHTDNAETGPRDRNLGARRAEAVRRYLAEAGVPAGAIYARDHGATRPLVPTAPGVPEPQNRRVQLLPLNLGRTARLAVRRHCAAWVRENCIGYRSDRGEAGRVIPSCAYALDRLGDEE